MKRKWQTLLDTPLSREVIDRCGYLVDRANTKSKVWKDMALELTAKVTELTEELSRSMARLESDVRPARTVRAPALGAVANGTSGVHTEQQQT